MNTTTTPRQEITDLLNGTTGFSFKGADVLSMQKPCVYLWLRGDEVLYVGFGRGGAERPFSPRHKTLRVEPDDEVLIWPFETEEAAHRAEFVMIHAFSPTLNKQKSYIRHLLKDRLGVSFGYAGVIGKEYANGHKDVIP